MPGTCRSNYGAGPGSHPVIPNHSSRLGPDTAAPYAGNFEVCNYCHLIHKDSHAQGLYPLLPQQLASRGSAPAGGGTTQVVCNHEPVPVPAGKPTC